ncbi:MAG: hypothetical protein RNU03_10025 [Candidatus Sedimenticola sp. (ex Thyasira tokunagai)]
MKSFLRLLALLLKKPDISSKCQQLADKWEKHALRSECYNNEIFAGAIDEKLHHFLDVAKGFLNGFVEDQAGEMKERKLLGRLI